MQVTKSCRRPEKYSVMDKLEQKKINLFQKEADAYVINLGPVNLVSIVTERGMLACGAFNVKALDKFNYPAAVVWRKEGRAIATIEDLLSGVIKETNDSAMRLGIVGDMPAKAALAKL